MSHRLLPEWAPQEAIILAWPDAQTDWAPWLDNVRQTYCQLITAINQVGCGVLLLVRADEVANAQAVLQANVSEEDNSQVLLVVADYNDTWVRDYGFLTCRTEQGMQLIEFQFNGWGNKFNASKDNQINSTVLADLCQFPMQSYQQFVEGGALEIDGAGHLLSTALCLQNPERNGDFSLAEYQQLFTDALGASRVSIFHEGHLEGDDTDGHIDTLVRFTPNNGLVIQACENRPDDSHYAGLHALVEECRQVFPEHQLFLLPLPSIFNDDGERLPASYANYLINNQQVLCPIYQQPEDQQALEILAKAYPQHHIVAIDGLPLVQQFGSVHCISMQVPVGTLKANVIQQLQQGVSVYA
ncbi:agmatine deiminase family protein [Alteromonadaceae bacterium BrNp21-10]|nr:agmatine deiminase family protein [Alteromonadaceae bacterium BrNp21-10]